MRSFGSLTALIVEDSAAMRQLLMYALKRIPGMNTIEACHGLEALRALDDGLVPDIIFTDINMPVMDGLTMLERLREDSRFRETPVVVITTERGAVDRARAFRLGAQGYITKPIRAPQVLREVGSLLRL